VALAAKRYQVSLHVLVAKPFVCLVMNFQPPQFAVVAARLAAVSVNFQPLLTLFGPLAAADVARVKVECFCAWVVLAHRT
jgi:hypothetical protein